MKKKLNLAKDLADANRRRAVQVRALLAQYHVLALNLIGSPGCGKTSLLEATLPRLRPLRVAVIEGDIATSRDADRIAVLGVPCVQINTEGACHLIAAEIAEVLEDLHPESLDLLFIENVGNLVCPSTADLGEDAKIALVSLPEGDDKVAKYPRLFREAALAILNKIDLAGVLTFDVARVRDDLARIKSDLPLLELSARTGLGMDAWIGWLRAAHERKRRS